MHMAVSDDNLEQLWELEDAGLWNGRYIVDGSRWDRMSKFVTALHNHAGGTLNDNTYSEVWTKVAEEYATGKEQLQPADRLASIEDKIAEARLTLRDRINAQAPADAVAQQLSEDRIAGSSGLVA